MDNTTEVVNKVLDIILNPRTDFKDIVCKLARQEPEMLLRIVGGNDMMFPELRGYCERGQKIPAIKYVRNISPMSLKDAKEFVEEYVESNGIVSSR